MQNRSAKNLILYAATAASALSVLCTAPAAPAVDHAARGINVVGEGTVTLKPAFVVIAAVAHGEAALASDAIVKCGDIKRRGTRALAALKLANLTVRAEGMEIDASGGSNPDEEEAQQTQESSVAASERIEIKLAGIDGMTRQQIHATLAKLIDACLDSGLRVEDHPAFKLVNNQEAHDQAYDLAMKDAMRQARRFAELVHAKVGPILCAEEIEGESESDSDTPRSQTDDRRDPVLSQEPVRVRLSVQFEVSR